MTLQAIDTGTLYALMAAGFVFALAGLYLILKRKDDENAARIELFGLKFQSSSVGTLVFLVGAAFLVLPMFAPREDAAAVLPEPSRPGAPVAEAQGGDSAPPSGRPAIVLPAAANAAEVEDNNAISDANQFSLGHGVRGALDARRDDGEDWYVVDLGPKTGDDVSVQVRGADGACEVFVFDAREEQLATGDCPQNGGSVTLDVFLPDAEKLFVRVAMKRYTLADSAQYELFVREGS